MKRVYCGSTCFGVWPTVCVMSLRGGRACDVQELDCRHRVYQAPDSTENRDETYTYLVIHTLPLLVPDRVNLSHYAIAFPTVCFFFFQAEDGIRDVAVTGVQTCALPIYREPTRHPGPWRCSRAPRTARCGPARLRAVCRCFPSPNARRWRGSAEK